MNNMEHHTTVFVIFVCFITKLCARREILLDYLIEKCYFVNKCGRFWEESWGMETRLLGSGEGIRFGRMKPNEN